MKELCSLLAQGGFKIRKWVSNSPLVMDSIPVEDHSKRAKERDLNSPLEERALGVYWDVDADCFGYRVKTMEKPLTRRGLLSMLSSVYDPLGFASPYILKARKIVQELCRLKKEWDDPIPEEHREKWNQWTAALPGMTIVRVPRCLQPQRCDTSGEYQGASMQTQLDHGEDQVKEYRLHHFADASEVAYGVVSYLRTEYTSGRVSTVLTMAKARLAPLKVTTIPRLELSAATLATRQDELLRRELDLDLEPSQYWSDSTIVLWYINHEEKRFQTFVANRVSEIRGRSNPSQWRHVSTDDNPADDASRGSLPSVLMEQRWLEGPQFLKEEPSNWPTLQMPGSVDPGVVEVKSKPACLACVEGGIDPVDKLLGRYSRWPHLVRGVARVLLLKTAWRNKTARRNKTAMETTLKPEHLRRAEEAIVRHIQAQHYSKEIAALRANGQVDKSSSMARLSPRLQGGLLVSTG